MQERWVQLLGREDSLKEMATHSSSLAWKISWTEEPGGLQSTGLQSQTQPSTCTRAGNFLPRLTRGAVISLAELQGLTGLQDTGQAEPDSDVTVKNTNGQRPFTNLKLSGLCLQLRPRWGGLSLPHRQPWKRQRRKGRSPGQPPTAPADSPISAPLSLTVRWRWQWVSLHFSEN